jgi:hypothetical protein
MPSPTLILAKAATPRVISILGIRGCWHINRRLDVIRLLNVNRGLYVNRRWLLIINRWRLGRGRANKGTAQHPYTHRRPQLVVAVVIAMVTTVIVVLVPVVVVPVVPVSVVMPSRQRFSRAKRGRHNNNECGAYQFSQAVFHGNTPLKATNR